MRLLALFCLFLFSTFVNAADYVWTGLTTSPDPMLACAQTISNGSYTIHNIIFSSPIFGHCNYQSNSGTAQIATGTVSRTGTSCPAGTTNNPDKGTCDLPSAPVGSLCDGGGTGVNVLIHSISGLCVTLLEADPTATCSYLASKYPSGTLRVHGSVDASGAGVAPGKVSVQGMCEGVVGDAACVVPPSKCTKGLCTEARSSSCNVSYTLNGRPVTPAPDDNGLAAKNDLCLDVTNCNLPDPQTEKQDDPCTKVTDAEGRQGCSIFEYVAKDGTGNCGSVNGVFGCSGVNPTSTGTETQVTTTTKANADGSTTDTTQNSATQTSCNGFGTGSCTSTVTNSQTTTVKNSTGTTTSTGTTCTGKLCSTSTNPDANGDGIGDCIKDCDGSGASASKLTAPTQGNFDGEDDKWDKKINDAKTDFKDRLDKLSALFKPISNINLGGGGHLYCPPAISVLGHDISFCLDQYAGSLSWISQVILLVCTVSALFIIFL
jgi:hypothetical protein